MSAAATISLLCEAPEYQLAATSFGEPLVSYAPRKKSLEVYFKAKLSSADGNSFARAVLAHVPVSKSDAELMREKERRIKEAPVGKRGKPHDDYYLAVDALKKKYAKEIEAAIRSSQENARKGFGRIEPILVQSPSALVRRLKKFRYLPVDDDAPHVATELAFQIRPEPGDRIFRVGKPNSVVSTFFVISPDEFEEFDAIVREHKEVDKAKAFARSLGGEQAIKSLAAEIEGEIEP